MRCPKVGTRVVFDPTPSSLFLYRSERPSCLPRPGTKGTITTVPLPGGRRSCMAGPGGGLIYVDWDNGCTHGVSKNDLYKASGAPLAGAGRRRSRRKTRR